MKTDGYIELSTKSEPNVLRFEHAGYLIRILRSLPGWSIEFDLHKSFRYEHTYGTLAEAEQFAKNLIDKEAK